MNSLNATLEPVNPSCAQIPLTLEVLGMGHVPSFKNSKQISVNRRTGKRFLRTDTKKAEWMERAIRALEYQLTCAFQTDAAATSTGLSARSWIASSTPADDSWKHIAEITIRAVTVPHGNEGARIQIQRI